MSKKIFVLQEHTQAGARKSNAPRRNRKSMRVVISRGECAGAVMKKNLQLCLDLETYLREDSLPKWGKDYHGVLTQASEDRVCFVEKEIRKHDRRNIHIFEGRYITATYRSSDGHVRLNFKQIRLYPGFNTLAYATGVMYEIQKVLNSLVEK